MRINYFINNIRHAFDDAINDNDWNNTEIGNYWDNYTNVDKDDDGIGDEPHVFNGGTDYLPIWDDGPDPTFWTFYSLHIDDDATASGNGTWTWAASQKWCNGSGTLNDPYLIENFRISFFVTF